MFLVLRRFLVIRGSFSKIDDRHAFVSLLVVLLLLNRHIQLLQNNFVTLVIRRMIPIYILVVARSPEMGIRHAWLIVRGEHCHDV